MVAESTEQTDTPRKRGGSRMVWAYALTLTILVAYFVLPETVGSHVRSYMLTKFREHWPNHVVRIGAVRFEPKVGLILDDLKVWPKDAAWNATPLVHIHHLVCTTRMQWDRCTSEPFASDQLIVEGLQCEVRPDAQGNWPIQQLWPPPSFGKGAPLITVRNGRAKVYRDATSPAVALELRDLQLSLRKQSGGSQFRAVVQTDVSGPIAVQGAVLSDGQIEMVGQAEQLRIDPSLLMRLPAAQAALAKPLDGLACLAEVTFRCAGAKGQPWRIATRMRLTEGRYSSPLLPYPLERFSAQVLVTNHGAEIEYLDGKMGGAAVHADGKIEGLTKDAKLDLRLTARDAEINATVLAALPEKIRSAMDQVSPRGLADVELRLRRDGKVVTAGTAVLRGMDVEAVKFPYPVRGVTGVIHWSGNQVHAEQLIGTASGQKVRCDMDLTAEKNGPFDIHIQMDGPAPVDEALMRALTPRGQTLSASEKVVRSLSPQGMVQLQDCRIRRDQEGRSTRLIKLQVLSGRVRYQGFPYPIYDVQGLVEIDEHGVRLNEFRGQNNDAATINLTGGWTQAVGPTGGRLDLKIDGYGMPLDDSLRSALPARIRQTWDSLEPGGTLDHLHVQLSADEGQPPQYAITAQQWGADSPVQRTVSLRPVALPYRLDVRRAVVRMNGDAVLIEQLDGWHGPSHLTTTGHCTRNGDGQWVIHLDVLPGSRIQGDTDLLEALPAGPRTALTEICLQGPVGVRGTTDIALPRDEQSAPEMDWNLLVQLEGNELGKGSEVRGVRGELSFAGSRRGDDLHAYGQVRVDSLHVKGVQATKVTGPYELRDGKVHWGRAMGANGTTPSEPVTAHALGGQVTVDGTLTLTDARYQFNATLADADVPTMLADLGQPHAAVRGRCGMTLNNIQGIMGQNRALSGMGTAYLREANLYQLPPIVMLLGVLRVDPREDTAFTTGDTKFHIDGDRVVFDSIQLWGDLIALYGGGTINARRDLDLVFDTHVSPQSVWSQVMRPISGQRYNLWSIQVQGTMDNPDIRRLPQVEKALDRILPESAKSDGETPLIGSLPLMRRLGW